MLRTALAALMAVFLFVGPASGHTHKPAAHHAPCKTHHCIKHEQWKCKNSLACMEKIWLHKCSDVAPRACVERAIVHYKLYGWQRDWMRRIPSCESGWDHGNHNPSGASGLYQFMPGTWAGTPYGGYNVYEAKWNALAAAWMVTRGRTGEWVCR